LSTNEPQGLSREFKLEALRRLEAGVNVSVLARELGVSCKHINRCRDRYRLGGSSALRNHGRMTKAEASAMVSQREVPTAEGSSFEQRSLCRSFRSGSCVNINNKDRLPNQC
jgi:transposase-like protein